MPEIYLDNNATTRPLKEVVEASTQAMTNAYGNPSSPHARGSIAARSLHLARQRVAGLVGCPDDGIIFTSGGTEANNLVLGSFCKLEVNSRLITTNVEHASVLNVAHWLEDKGVQVEYLDVDEKGRISLERLDALLAQPANLVSIQWANSETGTLQPIEEAGLLCRKRDIPLHVDAAQAIGRIPIDMQRLPVNVLTFTAHKIHGPQGVGAVSSSSLTSLAPISQGGSQEAGYRPGTENLPGIAGFGIAAHMRNESFTSCVSKMKKMRDTFEKNVLAAVPQAKVNGDIDNRAVNSTNISFPGKDGTAMMAHLDREGVSCSLTSACAGARPVPSHVLVAMGLSEDMAYSSLRFSFSVLNSVEDAKNAAEKVCEIHDKLARNEVQASMRA